MKPENQIKALAELDGWEYNPHSKGMVSPHGVDLGLGHPNLTRYLTSRDAIMPVIEKLWNQYHDQLDEALWQVHWSDKKLASRLIIGVLFTPAQLCEALLRATGKWTD